MQKNETSLPKWAVVITTLGALWQLVAMYAIDLWVGAKQMSVDFHSDLLLVVGYRFAALMALIGCLLILLRKKAAKNFCWVAVGASVLALAIYIGLLNGIEHSLFMVISLLLNLFFLALASFVERYL